MRIETDPADRSQLRMTIASGDPALTFEYVFNVQVYVFELCIKLYMVNDLETILRLKEFIKEQLVNIPIPSAPMPPQAQPISPPVTATSDPGDLLAGLLN